MIDVGPETMAALMAEGTRSLSRLPDEQLVDDKTGQGSAGAMLVALTHDLRSPLGSMLLMLEQLRSGATGPLSREQERQLSLVYSAARPITALTNDAFDLACRRCDLAGFPPGPFDVADVLDQVRAMVQPMAEVKGIRLRVACAVHGRRLGHPTLLQRVLLNLVTNAIKYTAAGAVTVEVRETAPAQVGFQVTDTGGGLPAAVRRMLCDAGDHAPLLAGTTSGLGLALCVALLGRCDSRLAYAPGASGGSCLSFHLHLPSAQPS
ncbi:MAG: sensor histidine kinase [Gemmatimonadaceae bacterium]